VSAEVEALRRVAQAAAGALPLDEVLACALDAALEVAGGGAGSMWLCDDAGGVYRRVAARGAGAPPILPFDGVAAEGALPLRAVGQEVGLLRVASPAPSVLPVLAAIADQAALAVVHARTRARLEARVRVTTVLQRFGERALALDSGGDLYRLIVDAAMEVARADRGLASRISERCSRVMAAVGKVEAIIGLELSVDEPYLAESLASPEPYIVEDALSLDPTTRVGEVAHRNRTGSFALLTMRYGGAPIGQIFVASDQRQHYGPEEIEGLQLLSSMAAEALERARVHAAVENDRRRLDAVIENLPVVVTILDSEGRIRHLNAEGRRLAEQMGTAGLDWRTALSQMRMFDGEGRPIGFDERVSLRAFQGIRTVGREIVLTNASGDRRVTTLAFSAPLPSPDERVHEVVSGFQDVTALREMADAKDRFLRIASHELRSPLTSLRATVSLLQLDASAIVDEARRTTLLSRIDRQTERLTRLVEELLDMTRINARELPLARADIDLTALCREAIELTCVPAGHRCDLDAAGEARGQWDPLRIEQVVTNLLANAIRYSPTDRPILVRVRADERVATVEVIDQGMGIPAQQLAHVFTPFFRGSNVVGKGGLGLGLHIASEIVRRHGGTLRVASEEGRGSTFTVELPRA
jgi:signal transduction histidine kinase/GAF domain-containing protein